MAVVACCAAVICLAAGWREHWLFAGIAVLLLMCSVLLWVASAWCIVFDTTTAAIYYSRLWLFNRLLVKFDNIDSIAPVSNILCGTCYVVTGRNGKRIRISAWYRFSSRQKKMYEATMLPVLEDMIQESFQGQYRHWDTYTIIKTDIL